MMARVLFVWMTFSFALLSLALFSQNEPFVPEHLAWSVILSLPVAMTVLRGGLGNTAGELRYPSISMMIVSAWIMTVGPSLVAENQEVRYFFHYSDIAFTLARVLFLGWCTLFVLATGRPRSPGLHVKPSFTDFISIAGCTLVVAGYLASKGMFSSYQSERTLAPTAGSAGAMAVIMGAPLFVQGPPLFFLILTRAKLRGSLYLATAAGFVGSWVLLFLLASRTSLVVAVAACLVLCRCMGLRLRANTVLALSVAFPAVLLLVMVYRNALGTSEHGVKGVGQYISIASEATSSLDNADAQSNAVDLVRNNAHVRLWYGQIFCILIDEWLDQGAAMRGSLFSGAIASLPTMLVSNKNAAAADLDFELLLHKTQRFPEGDLPPTPWMQWLYELGLPGLVLGALVYSWLVRLIESRVNRTTSFYEVAFWLQMFGAILPPEHTTDVLVIVARSALVLVLVLGSLSGALHWLASSGRDTRPAH